MTLSRLPEFVYLAIEYWNELGHGTAAPDQIDSVRPIDKRKDKREVYRFRNAVSHGIHVIAKRCLDHAKTRKELAVYQQMLPQLPVTTPTLYGSFHEQDADRLWLFIEDANGMNYDSTKSEHRQLAGKWLATLHTEAADCSPIPDITEEPRDFDLHCIQVAQQVLTETMSNPRLDDQDIRIMSAILGRCPIFELHRDAMQELYNRLPVTLVHGDFSRDNMQVRSGANCPELVVFDWGYTRWETPLPDITKMLGYDSAPDLESYSQIVQKRWPELALPMILRLGFLNEVFIAFNSIRWEAEKLRYEWVEAPMTNLRLYQNWLDEIIQAEPWTEEARAGPHSRLPGPREWR